MAAPPSDKKKKLRFPDAAPGGDFFYDELMTAQPEATQEFYRARLKLEREAAKKKSDTDK